MAAAVGFGIKQADLFAQIYDVKSRSKLKKLLLRALPRTSRQRYARSCTLTLAHSCWVCVFKELYSWSTESVATSLQLAIKNVKNSVFATQISIHILFTTTKTHIFFKKGIIDKEIDQFVTRDC